MTWTPQKENELSELAQLNEKLKQERSVFIESLKSFAKLAEFPPARGFDAYMVDAAPFIRDMLAPFDNRESKPSYDAAHITRLGELIERLARDFEPLAKHLTDDAHYFPCEGEARIALGDLARVGITLSALMSIHQQRVS